MLANTPSAKKNKPKTKTERTNAMLSHSRIWQGIDNLAKEQGLSASALARKAGLDPTIFNKSKRISTNLKPRWPSTESLMRVLETSHCSFGHFITLMSDHMPADDHYTLPIIDGKNLNLLDRHGLPDPEKTRKIILPLSRAENLFAIKSSAIETPPMQEQNLLIIAPHRRVTPGDLVLVKKRGREKPFTCKLHKQMAYRIETRPAFAEIPIEEHIQKDILWISSVLGLLFSEKDFT